MTIGVAKELMVLPRNDHLGCVASQNESSVSHFERQALSVYEMKWRGICVCFGPENASVELLVRGRIWKET